jgi:hypothetical protein
MLSALNLKMTNDINIYRAANEFIPMLKLVEIGYSLVTNQP